MLSGKLHSNNEDLEIRFKETNLKNDDEDLIQKKLQSENKLVESCPRTHVDNSHCAAERKNENLVQTCPRTSLDNLQ